MEAAQALRDQLRRAMIDAEMNQVELARRMGTRQGYVSDILSGRKTPGRKSLGAILRVFPNLRPLVMALLDASARRNAA